MFKFLIIDFNGVIYKSYSNQYGLAEHTRLCNLAGVKPEEALTSSEYRDGKIGVIIPTENHDKPNLQNLWDYKAYKIDKFGNSQTKYYQLESDIDELPFNGFGIENGVITERYIMKLAGHKIGSLNEIAFDIDSFASKYNLSIPSIPENYLVCIVSVDYEGNMPTAINYHLKPINRQSE